MASENTLWHIWQRQLEETYANTRVVVPVGRGYMISDFIPELQNYWSLIKEWPGDKNIIFSQCKRIKHLIKRGADVNAKNEEGVTALLLAIHCWRAILSHDNLKATEKSLEIVREILARGANPNVQDRYGLTPLHLAIAGRNSETSDTNHELIRLLIESGAHINPPLSGDSSWTSTPLVASVEERQLETVKLLLSFGADVNASIGDKTALSAALSTGADLFPNRISAITATLLEHSVDVKKDESRILASAISHTPESVEHFLNECYGSTRDEPSEHGDGYQAKQSPEGKLVALSTEILLRPLIDDLTGHERRAEDLCSSCLEFGQKGHYRKWYPHSADAHALSASISAGCGMCQLIKDCIPASSAIGEVSLYYYSALLESDTLAKHYFEKILVRGQVSDGFRYGELRLAAVDDNTADILSRVHGLNDKTTNSEPAFQLASHWVKTCLKDHGSACQVFGDKFPPLPTRVIDVRPSNDSEDPRLLVSNGRKGHYITLSYCWGDKANLCTESQTLELFTRAIPFHRIPKTIQEAIVATRRLGIQYLWVDTLCIIQDSPEDWLHEAKNIASVYRDSLLTIAAAASVDSQGGLFRERKRLRTRPVRFAPHLVPSDLGKPESIYVFGDRQETNDGFRSSSRLDERGWVLQEQLLSPRTLNFSSQELYWDCPGLSASESYPAGIPKDHDHNFERRHFTEMKTRILDISLPVDAERVHMLWQRMLVLYSKRKLSRQTDKLVALAGAAKQVSIALEDKLVAGLWVRWLWRDLLWWVDRPEASPLSVDPTAKDNVNMNLEAKAGSWKTRLARPLKRPSQGSLKSTISSAEEFQSPSWSWASIQGPISYDFPRGTSPLRYYPCLQVLSCTEIVLPESNGISGRLSLRGVLLQAKLGTISTELATPGWEYISEKSRKMRLSDWTEDDILANGLIWKPDTGDDISGDIVCLVVAASHLFIVALGLLPIPGVENEYKRVGSLYWSSYDFPVPEKVVYQVLTLI